MSTDNKLTKINIQNQLDMLDVFDWLPHDNSIIMVKDILSINPTWGKALIDNVKIKQSEFFNEVENIPIEYSLELIAQSLGLIGAAQSIYNLADRNKAQKAFITGFKNLNFCQPTFSLDAPLFVEILEIKAIEGFKFCDISFYSQINEGDPLLLTTGVLKVYSLDR